MKTRSFTALASMTVDLKCDFEITEDVYKHAIAEHGTIFQWARENLDGGLFIDDGQGGEWNMYDISETTED